MLLRPERTGILALVAVVVLTLPTLVPRGYMPHMDGQGHMSIRFCMEDMCPFALASGVMDTAFHSLTTSGWGPLNIVDGVVRDFIDVTAAFPPLPARGPPFSDLTL